MSDARDELVDEIAGHPIGSGYYSTTVGIDEAREIADAILAAGYSKPRTISDPEELDALRYGSVVLDADRATATKLDADYWEVAGYASHFRADAVTLPATVLYEPQP